MLGQSDLWLAWQSDLHEIDFPVGGIDAVVEVVFLLLVDPIADFEQLARRKAVMRFLETEFDLHEQEVQYFDSFCIKSPVGHECLCVLWKWVDLWPVRSLTFDFSRDEILQVFDACTTHFPDSALGRWRSENCRRPVRKYDADAVVLHVLGQARIIFVEIFACDDLDAQDLADKSGLLIRGSFGPRVDCVSLHFQLALQLGNDGADRRWFYSICLGYAHRSLLRSRSPFEPDRMPWGSTSWNWIGTGLSA